MTPKNTRAIFSEGAERAVLAAMLADAHYIDDVRDILKPGDFFIVRHNTILDAVYTLKDRNAVVDMVTIGQELNKRGKYDDVGGSQYLAELLGAGVNVTGVKAHAQVVADYALRRRIGELAEALRRAVENPTVTTDELRNRAEDGVRNLRDVHRDDEPVDMVKGVGDYFDRVEATLNQPAGVSGLATGFYDYDDRLDGLRGLSILAGRPGMGKSALAANVALNVALSRTVYFLSMEMGIDELMARFFAIVGDLDTYKQRRGLRPGGMTDEDWARFVKTTGSLSKHSMFFDTRGTVKLSWLRHRIEWVKRRRPDLGLIIIDYLQLMEGEGRADNREKEVGKIARGLKNLSMDIGVPVMALSQFNRAVEGRQDKRPTAADLRESGEIENAADQITAIYRDVEYHPETVTPNLAELIILKNRSGAKGTVKLYFDASRTLFKNATVERHDLKVLTYPNGANHDVKRATGSLLKITTGAPEDADAG